MNVLPLKKGKNYVSSSKQNQSWDSWSIGGLVLIIEGRNITKQRDVLLSNDSANMKRNSNEDYTKLYINIRRKVWPSTKCRRKIVCLVFTSVVPNYSYVFMKSIIT